MRVAATVRVDSGAGRRSRTRCRTASGGELTTGAIAVIVSRSQTLTLWLRETKQCSEYFTHACGQISLRAGPRRSAMGEYIPAPGARPLSAQCK